MKKNILILILLIIAAASLSGCRKDEKALIRNLKEMEEEYYTAGDLKAKERELKEAIREYKDILEMQIESARNLGIYYKSLGKLYFDNSMYMLGADAFSEAIKINPENSILFYYRGLCYARYSKSAVSTAEEVRILKQAERSYHRAVELDNNFSKAIYALSILYVFELDMPEKAVDTLERLLEIQKSNYDAMFLLANAYIRIGIADKADALYQKIIKNSRNSEYRRQAEENRKAIKDGTYGW